MSKILVIDDDPSLLRALRVGLQAKGHVVVTAVTGEQGISQAALSDPDVVVLDLGLPDIDGLSVCKRIRQWSEVPVVVLSAADDEERKVAALDMEADDYVTKPFGMGELEARIRTAVRHRHRDLGVEEPTHISVGTLNLDLVHHEARKDGQLLELTSKEFDLLAYLAHHAGKTCTHKMILESVWGRSYGSETSYLHAYIHRLRQKLRDESGALIVNSPGIGYILTAHPGET